MELDCLEIVQQLDDLNQFPSQPHMTITAFWEMLKRYWAVTITHVYWGSNRVADGLAKYATGLPLGMHKFSYSPDAVIPENATELAVPRLVHI
ncbi:hypothetical protein PVK06_002133 [Gossypium arboreum]|uniref:RNase H type-1 domain-containing protein n=1 Tax=Gossypium arboreum TaxID=29729 RepID=A0ABR0R2V3_GOSAR|nr:hypothetical protein PVK06_002133 [Gossypium arboreum]